MLPPAADYGEPFAMLPPHGQTTSYHPLRVGKRRTYADVPMSVNDKTRSTIITSAMIVKRSTASAMATLTTLVEVNDHRGKSSVFTIDMADRESPQVLMLMEGHRATGPLVLLKNVESDGTDAEVRGSVQHHAIAQVEVPRRVIVLRNRQGAAI